jgi:hypothetical protein
VELLQWHRRGLEELDHAREAIAALMNALVGEIVQLVMAQVDLNRILAEIDVDDLIARVDVEALIARVDIQGVLSRVDMAAIAEEIDIESIIRDSTGALSGEVVTTLRVQGIRADDTVTRIVDRVLRRHRPPPTAPTSGGELAP